MLVLAIISLILHNSMRLHVSQCFHFLETIMCKKRVFTAKKRVLAHSTSFLLRNVFKRREMLVLALVSLILHISMRLHISQCFHFLKTIMCKKRVFTAKKRVLAHSTSFLLKNVCKRREMLVLALVSLILHNSMRLHVSQCFHCVKTDNVQKTRFSREITSFCVFNVVFAEKRV